MNMKAKVFLVSLISAFGATHGMAEDSRLKTEYDVINEESSRVKIWDQDAVNEGAPKSYGAQTQAKGGVGILAVCRT